MITLILRNFFKLNFILILFTTVNSYSQSLSLNADLVNRYIWRGLNAGGESPSIQPNIALTFSSFTLGCWGAYPLEPKNLEEIDFYFSYNYQKENIGSFNFGVTDYIFPNSGTPVFNFNNYNNSNGSGAHFVELNAGYLGPDELPISLAINIFIYNLENNPIYFQAGYNTQINDVDVSFFVGGTPGESNLYYGTDKFDIINAGITVSRSIQFTENFNLPIFGSIIGNPASDKMYYVVGIRL